MEIGIEQTSRDRFELSQSGSTEPPNSNAIVIIRKLKRIEKDLKNLMSKISFVDEVLTDNEILIRRRTIRTTCLQLMKLPQFRQMALESFWNNCIYGPINVFKLAEHFEEDFLREAKSFITNAVAELSKLLGDYDDSRFTVLLYLGDLYRYSYQWFGKNQKDLSVSADCYKKASVFDPTNGRPFNQIALLVREQQPLNALMLFMRSLILKGNTTQSLKNIISLNDTVFTDLEEGILFKLIQASIFNFSRMAFESARKEFDEIFERSRSFTKRKRLQFLQICSMATLYVVCMEENDEQFRYTTSFVFNKFTNLIDSVRQMVNKWEQIEEEKQLSGKRRRCRNHSSSSDSSTSSNVEDVNEPIKETNAEVDDLIEIWLLIILIAEFISNIVEHFIKRKLSVSLKLQYQNLLKSYIDLLNELLTYFPAITANLKSNAITKVVLLSWSMGDLFFDEVPQDKFVQIASYFIGTCIANPNLAITFENFFKTTGSTSSKEQQAIDAFSRLHFEHVDKKNQKTSKIPVYIAPDHNAFLINLPLVKRLSTTSRQTMIIARYTLAKLDKIKKESAEAREAIRWIQQSIPKGHVRMLPHTGLNFTAECLKFLEGKDLLDKKTVFLSILTTENEGLEYKNPDDDWTKYPVISLENINSFASRIANDADDLEEG